MSPLNRLRKPSQRESSMITGLAAAIAVAASSAGAPALASSVNVGGHHTTGSSTYTFTEGATPESFTDGRGDESQARYHFGFDYNFLNEPLVELDANRASRTQTLVEGLQTFELSGGVELDSRFSLNL